MKKTLLATLTIGLIGSSFATWKAPTQMNIDTITFFGGGASSIQQYNDPTGKGNGKIGSPVNLVQFGAVATSFVLRMHGDYIADLGDIADPSSNFVDYDYFTPLSKYVAGSTYSVLIVPQSSHNIQFGSLQNFGCLFMSINHDNDPAIHLMWNITSNQFGINTINTFTDANPNEIIYYTDQSTQPYTSKNPAFDKLCTASVLTHPPFNS